MATSATSAIAPARQPVLARRADNGSRFYEWQGETFWSVTELIGGGVPKHLQAWYAKLVAELAYVDLTSRGPYARPGALVRRWARAGREWIVARKAAGELKTLKLEQLTDMELALRWLKGEPERVRDAAAAKGSAVHAEAEDYVLEQAAFETAERYAAGETLPRWPDQVRPHMQNSFVPFLREHEPEFLLTEATVFNRTQHYAGTLDAGMLLPRPAARMFNGEPVLVDYKSGRAVYPEVALQLSAYARGEFVGLRDRTTAVALPEFHHGAVLHLTPKGPYELRPVRIEDDVFTAFLFAREIYRWKTETAKTVLYEPLPRPEVAA